MRSGVEPAARDQISLSLVHYITISLAYRIQLSSDLSVSSFVWTCSYQNCRKAFRMLWAWRTIVRRGTCRKWQHRHASELLTTPPRFNHPVCIRWTVQTVKFLIVEPSPLPILTPLQPKYSPQDPVFKYPSSLNVRDHVSQSYSTTGNIIVLYILIFKFLGRNREDKRGLDWIITWISCFKSTFYFVLNRIWICH